MTPKQAAEVIGCSPQYVRDLIRLGKIKATKKPNPMLGPGYNYEITQHEAERVRDGNRRETRGQKRKAS